MKVTTRRLEELVRRNVGNLLNNVAGSQTLTKEEIEPVMADLQEDFTGVKNVAVEVADAKKSPLLIHSSVRRSSASDEPRR